GVPETRPADLGSCATGIDLESFLIAVRVGALEPVRLPGGRDTTVLLAVLAAHAAAREEPVGVHALVTLPPGSGRRASQHQKHRSEPPHPAAPPSSSPRSAPPGPPHEPSPPPPASARPCQGSAP